MLSIKGEGYSTLQCLSCLLSSGDKAFYVMLFCNYAVWNCYFGFVLLSLGGSHDFRYNGIMLNCLERVSQIITHSL